MKDPKREEAARRAKAEGAAAHHLRLQDALRISRLQALLDAARDVCDCCGRRAFFGFTPEAHGPNGAGNYVHVSKPGSSEPPRLCAASSIYSRIRFEDGAAVEPERIRGVEPESHGARRTGGA